MIGITSISHLRWLFPPLVPYGTTFPPPAERWDNKTLKNSLLIIDSTVSTGLREQSDLKIQ